MEDPTHCDLCKKPLLDGSYCQSFNGTTGEITETRCVVCDRIKRVDAYKESKILTTSLVMDAQLSKWNNKAGEFQEVYQEVVAVYETIKPEIKLFERDVWFNGLQSFAQKAKTKGTSASAEEVKLLCYTMCGRAMITLENKDSSITLITDEDSSENRMGMQGIYATGPNAIALLTRVRGLWDRGSLKMEEDREVRIAGT